MAVHCDGNLILKQRRDAGWPLARMGSQQRPNSSRECHKHPAMDREEDDVKPGAAHNIGCWPTATGRGTRKCRQLLGGYRIKVRDETVGRTGRLITVRVPVRPKTDLRGACSCWRLAPASDLERVPYYEDGMFAGMFDT